MLPDTSEREAARKLDLPRRPVRSQELLNTVSRVRIGEALDVEGVERVHVEPQPEALPNSELFVERNMRLEVLRTSRYLQVAGDRT